ncbi:hypothetical protein OH77DRAFT_1520182 [Trametes cingulata]|nr:hypothetical protein OH77DRAFT_1520182 [Trametes cingulata]
MSTPVPAGYPSPGAHGPATLSPLEVYWREVQPLLESRGYMLRPRYRKDWVPSWTGKQDEIFWDRAEDGISLPLRANVIDATRIQDNNLVYIKRVQTNSDEWTIATKFSSGELRHDPMNHCVPILDHFLNPGKPTETFLVMPFLRYINDPDFETLEDILDCGEQILEGLVFLHDHHVAHRDCAYKNIMMDAQALFPRGFHPIYQHLLPDIARPAPVISRIKARVKYYFTDFGISTMFPAEQEDRLVTGTLGQDQEVPELSDKAPYDPFKVDICLLGNLFHDQFLRRFRNTSMLEPLIEHMRSRDPASRPSAAEALRQWKAVRRRVRKLRRLWRLQSRDDPLPLSIARDVVYPFCLLLKAFVL